MLKYLLVVLAIVIGAAAGRAQVVERPVPFDSTGRVQSISPSLAARLGLTPSVWPVEGVYTEVRLYELSTGGFVLAAVRANGEITRYPITTEQQTELQIRVSEAVARVGRPATEENPDIISERAGGAFMRNQMLLAFTLYGGSLSAIVADETASPALYLMAPAMTFFIAANYAKHHPVSRAQNHLASDGALRVALMANGTLFALGVKDEPKAYAAATFGGGLAGTLAGIRLGRGFTDGEAHGATWGSTSLATTTFGLLGASGLLESDNSDRALVGGLVATGVVGYRLGLRYVRKARYVVTAGDVTAMALASGLGIMAAVTPIVDVASDSPEMIYGLVTAGFVGGQVVGDRLLVRPFDHTQGEGRLLVVGAVAGALMGGGVAVLAGAGSATFVMTLLTAGAIGGVVLTENFTEPRRAGTAAPRRAERGEGSRPRVSFSTAALAQTVARIPGRASLLTITF